MIIESDALEDAMILDANGVNVSRDLNVFGFVPSLRFEHEVGDGAFIETEPGSMRFGVNSVTDHKFRITSGAPNESLLLNSSGLHVENASFRVENGSGDSRFRVTTGAAIDSLIVNSAGVTAKELTATDSMDISGNNPAILFDQTDVNRVDSIRTHTGGMDLELGGSRKMAVFTNAPEDAIRLGQFGTTIKENLIIDNSKGLLPFVVVEIDHNNGQTFGLISANDEGVFDGGGIGFFNSSSSLPFFIQDSAMNSTLTAWALGVGIGTLFADSALHVYADGQTLPNARVVVENDLPSTGFRDMFSLINNGGSRFTIENTANDTKWAFSSDPGGRFTFSLDGTGGPEMSVSPDGRVLMGPGPSQNFDLRPNGNLILAGTLSQSSDENLKTAFREVDTEAMLNKISDMPIHTWQFKLDSPEVRHIGPTSQDFHAAFGLGMDDKTIAPVDGIGVSLAAIQALQQKLNHKDQRIDKLQSELVMQRQSTEQCLEQIDELTRRLQTLEDLLASED